MVSTLVAADVPFFIATGSSSDENSLIFEPISEALRVTLVPSPEDVLVQFPGDHDWCGTSLNWHQFIQRVVERVIICESSAEMMLMS
jgi:hypothetical protein